MLVARASFVLAALCLACGDVAAPNQDAIGGIGPGPYSPGQSYLGRTGHIEYLAGNSPVILSAAHGGDRTPSEIPDRTATRCGGTATTISDVNTRELALAIRSRHFERFGTWPHVVINHLHRQKLDANRDIGEAACGEPLAAAAWMEFHAFLEVARSAVLEGGGRGFYIDLHGHGHPIPRLELGYLLGAATLRLQDVELDNSTRQDTSSIRALAGHDARHSFSQRLRGPTSLGSLYAAFGYPAVPSADAPAPLDDEPYFSGGYNTRRYGCGIAAASLGGSVDSRVCGVQIEAHYPGVRDSAPSRARFADATVQVLELYLEMHWSVRLRRN